MFRILSLLLLVLVFTPLSAKAEGYLFISPQRLDLSKDARIGQLHLVNKSEDAKLYEIKLTDYAMGPEGTLTVAEDMPYSASDFLRYSPRRVTLQAGEDQYIRVMARMPKKLEAGGYHTHVEFNEIEGAFNRKGAGKDVGKNNASFEISSSYSVAIPVFVKNGETNGEADLISAVPTINKDKTTGEALVTIKRTGNDTAYNLVKINYIDSKGRSHVASTPARIPVYRETDEIKRNFALKLPQGVRFNGGEIKVSLHPLDSDKEGNELDAVTAKIR